MYTGTLINDLIDTAERIGNVADWQMKEELHEIFTMQNAVTGNDKVYQGAA
jgi:signal recognition particle GTPase